LSTYIILRTAVPESSEDTDSVLSFREVPGDGVLIEYLSDLIRLNHAVGGIGPQVLGIWRWQEDNTRDELELEFLGSAPEMDEEDQEYVIRPKGTALGDSIRFTVALPRDQ